MFRCEVSISNSHFSVRMSHQLPYCIQINSSPNKLACKVVPHVMPSEINNFCSFQKVAPSFPNVISRFPVTSLKDKSVLSIIIFQLSRHALAIEFKGR